MNTNMGKGLHMLSAGCLLALLMIGFSACDDWFDDDDPDGSSHVGKNFAEHLDTPWEMVFDPEGNLFVTQRPGVISHIDKNGNVSTWLPLIQFLKKLEK